MLLPPQGPWSLISYPPWLQLVVPQDHLEGLAEAVKGHTAVHFLDGMGGGDGGRSPAPQDSTAHSDVPPSCGPDSHVGRGHGRTVCGGVIHLLDGMEDVAEAASLFVEAAQHAVPRLCLLDKVVTVAEAVSVLLARTFRL